MWYLFLSAYNLAMKRRHWLLKVREIKAEQRFLIWPNPSGCCRLWMRQERWMCLVNTEDVTKMYCGMDIHAKWWALTWGMRKKSITSWRRQTDIHGLEVGCESCWKIKKVKEEKGGQALHLQDSHKERSRNHNLCNILKQNGSSSEISWNS